MDDSDARVTSQGDENYLQEFGWTPRSDKTPQGGYTDSYCRLLSSISAPTDIQNLVYDVTKSSEKNV
jgi:hypothetical protein